MSWLQTLPLTSMEGEWSRDDGVSIYMDPEIDDASWSVRLPDGHRMRTPVQGNMEGVGDRACQWVDKFIVDQTVQYEHCGCDHHGDKAGCEFNVCECKCEWKVEKIR